MRAYLTVFCGLSVAVVGAVGGLNYAVDPYLTHQWGTRSIQQLRPARERLGAWAKTYALARYRPGIVYVGNSRTEVGLPAHPVLYGGRAVFNAALSGATMADAGMMAHHAAEVARLRTLVWGLDAPSFSLDAGNTELDEALLANGRGYLARRALLNLQRAVSVDMTADTLKLLGGAQEGVCKSSLAFLGQRDTACLEHRFAQKGGTAAAVQPRLGEFVRGAGPAPAAYPVFQARLEELCREGAQVRLYVNPTHALMQDALYWSGKWDAMEAWLRTLVAMADARRAAGCDVTLHDFSGFNSITTEAVPQASGRKDMAFYWEPSHYRANVGRMILSRILEDGRLAPADFGVRLTADTIASHQARMRAARDGYHRERPDEARLARAAAGLDGRPGGR